MFAISPPPGYNVATVATWPAAESIHVIPSHPCSYGETGASFFSAIYPTHIEKYPTGDFLALAGAVMVTSENGGIGLLKSVNGAITSAAFQPNVGQHEGSAFVDCDVPSPCDLCVGVTCAPPDACHDAGVCDPLTGIRAYPLKSFAGGDNGLPEVCNGVDDNCDGQVDEGCDEDHDGYCAAGMAVESTEACPLDCNHSLVPPAYVGSIATMDTHSHGGGYSPRYREYWYPEWSGSTVFRYSAARVLLGTFDSGQGEMMQLAGDFDGSYYTANWDNHTVTKRAALGSALLWSRDLGAQMSGVAVDASYVYAMASTGAVVYQLDKGDGHVVRTFLLLGGSPTTTMYGGLAVTGGKLFVGRSNAVVYRYDLATRQLESQFNVATTIYNTAFDGARYCTSANDFNVYCYTIASTSCPDGAYGSDCDDADPATSPATIEACDGKDQNCNGVVDEGCDKDGDGYCDASLVTVGTPPSCPMGGGDCDDADALIHPNDGLVEICDGKDQNCNGQIDEGCDDYYDGYCAASMVVANTSACALECDHSLVAPTYVGSVLDMDTHSHGGGYSPRYREYWYPSWSGSTVYRYDAGRVPIGSFDSGQGEMMQLWGEADGTYYTANWDYHTVTKRVGPGSTLLWSTNLGVQVSGVTADQGYVYAMASSGFTVWQLDRSTGRVISTFQLVGAVAPTLYGGIAAVNGQLFVGRSDAKVYVYDLATHRLASQFNVATNVYNSAFDGTSYCISANDSNVDCYTLAQITCAPGGHGTDCNDGDASESPGAPELCDGKDQNCNGQIDETCDKDGDGDRDAAKVVVGTPAGAARRRRLRRHGGDDAPGRGGDSAMGSIRTATGPSTTAATRTATATATRPRWS